jgi:hypothetical protein
MISQLAHSPLNDIDDIGKKELVRNAQWANWMVSSAGEQTNMFLLLARIAGLDAQLCDSIFQGGSRFKVLLLAVVGKDCHLQRRRRD